MGRNLPHLTLDHTPHFITFVTRQRWVLPSGARGIVLDSCRHDHARMMHLYIVTVMPDHVHLILAPLANYDRQCMYRISEILWAIKSASAHRINALLGRKGPVWQEEYFDTALRRSESLEQKIEYILQNPVRARLVEKCEDYDWTWESPRPRAAAAASLLRT